MFAHDKEYLCTSYTYYLQKGNDKNYIRQFKNVTCHLSHVTTCSVETACLFLISVDSFFRFS